MRVFVNVMSHEVAWRVERALLYDVFFVLFFAGGSDRTKLFYVGTSSLAVTLTSHICAVHATMLSGKKLNHRKPIRASKT